VLPPVPRCSDWASSSLISPSRISLPRNCSRVGLHIDLFGACSAFTRVAARTLAPSPICDLLHRRPQPFCHLHDCSGCFRLERLAGRGLHPLESAAFPRRTQIAVVPHGVANATDIPMRWPDRRRVWGAGRERRCFLGTPCGAERAGEPTLAQAAHPGREQFAALGDPVTSGELEEEPRSSPRGI
jgi:hypothetical protein